MTYPEAVALYSECDKFMNGETISAESPLRAMSKKLIGGSFVSHLNMTCLAVYRVIADEHMKNN